MSQSLFNLAEYTNRYIFLTGKAGTGKTTFLNKFVKETQKQCIIAAPTGIAAINAGGVTLHSLFGLPLSTFVPTYDPVDRNVAINIPQLLPHFKFRKEKLKLLRSLEMLIIDEVSMLRADTLDMVDHALKSARRSVLPFGGVQLLLIGDLYQLPPVVKQGAEQMLYQHYASPYFFESKALQQVPFLTYELTTVYRQTDGHFLQLLNAIRNSSITDEELHDLHTRYQPMFEAQESYVYLVSHNYMADDINTRRLAAIPSASTKYKAHVQGEFKEHQYPNDPELALKIGAQVMFIRNDASEEKRFFNGKLARVTALEEDRVKVLPDGETAELTIEREKWEQKQYHADEQGKIEEDVVGSYEQFPFRLAWAVTIHKSQGLTFDKVIIDAGKSFTSGQVYVALSRCRTLEGVVLKSRISREAIINDPRVEDFRQHTDKTSEVEAIVEKERYNYTIHKLLGVLAPGALQQPLKYWYDEMTKAAFLHIDEEKEALFKNGNTLLSELGATHTKFAGFLHSKTAAQPLSTEDWQQIEDKSRGAVQYFFSKVKEQLYEPVKTAYYASLQNKVARMYKTEFKSLVDDIEYYLKGLQGARLLETNLFNTTTETFDPKAPDKIPTHVISFQLFEGGMLPDAIAEHRGFSVGTIYTHLAKIAETGAVDVGRIFNTETLHIFEQKFQQHNFERLTEWKAVLPDFDFNDIKLLLNHYRYLKTKQHEGVQPQGVV